MRRRLSVLKSKLEEAALINTSTSFWQQWHWAVSPRAVCNSLAGVVLSFITRCLLLHPGLGFHSRFHLQRQASFYSKSLQYHSPALQTLTDNCIFSYNSQSSLSKTSSSYSPSSLDILPGIQKSYSSAECRD